MEKTQEDTFQKNPRWWTRDDIGATAAVTSLGFIFFGENSVIRLEIPWLLSFTPAFIDAYEAHQTLLEVWRSTGPFWSFRKRPNSSHPSSQKHAIPMKPAWPDINPKGVRR